MNFLPKSKKTQKPPKMLDGRWRIAVTQSIVRHLSKFATALMWVEHLRRGIKTHFGNSPSVLVTWPGHPSSWYIPCLLAKYPVRFHITALRVLKCKRFSIATKDSIRLKVAYPSFLSKKEMGRFTAVK